MKNHTILQGQIKKKENLKAKMFQNEIFFLMKTQSLIS